MEKHCNFEVIAIMAITFAMLLFANLGLASNELHTPFNDALNGNVHNGKVNYKAIEENPNFQIYIESLKDKPTLKTKIKS